MSDMFPVCDSVQASNFIAYSLTNGTNLYIAQKSLPTQAWSMLLLHLSTTMKDKYLVSRKAVHVVTISVSGWAWLNQNPQSMKTISVEICNQLVNFCSLKLGAINT